MEDIFTVSLSLLNENLRTSFSWVVTTCLLHLSKYIELYPASNFNGFAIITCAFWSTKGVPSVGVSDIFVPVGFNGTGQKFLFCLFIGINFT